MANGVSIHSLRGLPLISFEGDLLTSTQSEIYLEALEIIEEAKKFLTLNQLIKSLKERVCETAYFVKNTIFFNPKNEHKAKAHLELAKRDLMSLKIECR